MRESGLVVFGVAFTIFAIGCGRVEDGDHSGGAAGGTGGTSMPSPWDDVVEAQSGERLKAVWIVGEGGLRVFRHWYDTLLETECVFDYAGDESVRCLPLAHEPQVSGHRGAGCGGPAAFLVPGCGGQATYYWREHSEDIWACGGAAMAVRRGHPVADSAFSFELAETECISTSTSSQMHVVVPGELAPMDLFVAAERMLDGAEGDRIRRGLLVADDGAVQVRSVLTDSEIGECWPSKLDSGAHACLPGNGPFDVGDCARGSARAVLHSDPGCASATHVAWSAPDPPPVTRVTGELRKLGAVSSIPPEELFVRVELDGVTTCEAARGSLDTYVIELLGSYPESRLVEMHEQPIGMGSVTSLEFVLPDGRAVPPVLRGGDGPARSLLRTDDGDCDPVSLEGEDRCIAGDVQPELPLFADSDCRERLVSGHPNREIFAHDAFGCTAELLDVTDAKSVTTYFRHPNGECQLTGITGLYYRAEPLDPPGFPKLELVTDP